MHILKFTLAILVISLTGCINPYPDKPYDKYLNCVKKRNPTFVQISTETKEICGKKTGHDWKKREARYPH